MTRREHLLITRKLEGIGSRHEMARADALLQRSEAARKEYHRLSVLRDAVAETGAQMAAGGDDPFFATRVMARLERVKSRRQEFAEGLDWAFRRIALVAIVLIAGLFALNVTDVSELTPARSTLEAVLALPPVSIDDAYQLNPDQNL